jgi:hypothetical protein
VSETAESMTDVLFKDSDEEDDEEDQEESSSGGEEDQTKHLTNFHHLKMEKQQEEEEEEEEEEEGDAGLFGVDCSTLVVAKRDGNEQEEEQPDWKAILKTMGGLQEGEKTKEKERSKWIARQWYQFVLFVFGCKVELPG